LGDVFVTFDAEFIKGLLKDPKPAQDFRLFAGRAQWSPAQLQNEMLGKAWYSVRADTSMIFSADPQYIWRTLFELAQPAPLVKFPDLPGGVAARSRDLSSTLAKRDDRTVGYPQRRYFRCATSSSNMKMTAGIIASIA
jgi:Uncharacterized ACR, COG1678